MKSMDQRMKEFSLPSIWAGRYIIHDREYDFGEDALQSFIEATQFPVPLHADGGWMLDQLNLRR